VKTADLTPGQTYAVNERFTGATRAGLVLDKALWRESDEWGDWDGAEKRTKARIVRKAPKGARIERSKGWGDYSRTGLPVLVLDEWDFSFTERAEGEQITEEPHSILERARDAMNIMGLVAEDHDGRSTDTTRRSVTIRVQTAKGVARKVTATLTMLRPQQIIAGWTEHVEAEAREAAAKAALARTFGEAKRKSVAQAQDFVTRVTALMGDGDTVRYNHSNERYDFHREWTSGGFSSTYEVSADVIARLLDLAEKGASS
jgi:hypothetical protein